MITTELERESHSPEAVQFMDLATQAVTSQSLEQFASFALPWIAKMGESQAEFIYVVPRRTLLPMLHYRGLAPGEVPVVEKLCRAELDRNISGLEAQVSSEEAVLPVVVSDYWLWPMREEFAMQGLLGIVPSARASAVPPIVWSSLVSFLGRTINSFLERMKAERQIAYLNTYLTVSSLVTQCTGLRELLENVLYFCTEVVSAQEASVLLLDEAKRNLTFYQIEGASQSALKGMCFPADRGIAGAVLQEQKSNIVNEVQQDLRFYPVCDSLSGVVTRNMIAIPLVTGEEAVGVLEVINKVGALPFTDEDHLLLHFIADEIAFGIRNARVFDFVVKCYCKQRQGQGSCKDCHRPLGAWTPCAKYLESIL